MKAMPKKDTSEKDSERVGYENTGHKSFDGRGRKSNSRGHENFATHRR